MILQIALGLVAGLLSWTLLEYIIHYPLGHLPKGKTLISAEHIKHHKDILYFSPLLLKLRGAIPLVALVAVASSLALGYAFAIGFTLSVATGWTTYEYLHQSIHVRGPTTWYGRWATRHHLFHHFARPDRNHGVTTPIWDFVFRTYQPVTQVQIRQRDVATVPWLAEALTMSEPPKFVENYSVRQ